MKLYLFIKIYHKSMNYFLIFIVYDFVEKRKLSRIDTILMR